ncbi:MAG: hypothetical protein P4M05_26380 [Bradyrhizobium sp.]|nr:hypothetical protein [Bradyrhizobium sp.]
MGRSRTWLAKAPTIASHGPLTDILIRLMLSVNDISLASDANDQWALTSDPRRISRRPGARMYFIRILLAHVYEALEIIKEISESPPLRAFLDDCEERTIRTFQELETFIRSPDMKTLDKMRNRVSFHYDRQLPGKNLKEIAAITREEYWTYSMGSEPLDWHFKLADAVIDRMVIRDVFGLKKPKSLQRSQETEVIARQLEKISITFTDFAAHFVRHYSR